MNYAQGFFFGLGIEQEQHVLLLQVQNEIIHVNRLRRHALKILNYGIVQECDTDLKALRETERALRSSLGMPQASYACPAGTMSSLEASIANGRNLEPAEARDCDGSTSSGSMRPSQKQISLP